MTTSQFFQRLIQKRALVFYTGYDITYDRNGRTQNGEDWLIVGNDVEGSLSIFGMIYIRIYDKIR
jgi:hypothetical protein